MANLKGLSLKQKAEIMEIWLITENEKEAKAKNEISKTVIIKWILNKF